MIERCEAPDRAGGAETGAECSLLACENSPNLKGQSRENQAEINAARRALVFDLLNESLGYSRIYAEVAQMFAGLGDDQGVIYTIRNFTAAAREVCRCCSDLRAIRERSAPQ